MLNARRFEQGVSLIELMVGMAIFASLLTLASPSFSQWIQNTRIRTAAQAIQNGLQLARAEAIKRNTSVSLSFTSTTDNDCALSTSVPNWIISMGDPSADLPAKCDSTPSDNDAPRIIQVNNGSAGSSNVVLAADQSIIMFNSVGRLGTIAGVTPSPAVNLKIDVTNPNGGNCATENGTMRCLRVTVTTGGQIRMCDPKRASTDPQGCPS